ncbi:MAG: hypothetical protein L6Q35_00685 [Phycisphaerales bacterium]|nr:hypothetical protein [Phycisphaerales bacterium]
MRTTLAGPTGAMQAGRSYEVSDAEARELIAGGFAVAADRGTKVTRAERAAGTDAPPATARTRPAPKASRT